MSCKRPYTVSSQIQPGGDQEKYVQVSSQQQSDMEKKKSQSIRKKAKLIKANDNTALKWREAIL